MGKTLKLSYHPYTLKLKHTFTVSSFSRNETPVVLTEIEYDGKIGYGEASLPQYLGETQESVMDFLSKIDFSQFEDPLDSENILNYVDNIVDENNAAKASVDIALHDLIGKLLEIPLFKYFGLTKPKNAYTSYTIGIDNKEIIKTKIDEAKDFKYLKIKLGTKNDKEIIETIRSVTNKPLYVDVNQGWKDKQDQRQRRQRDLHPLGKGGMRIACQPVGVPAQQVGFPITDPILAAQVFHHGAIVPMVNDSLRGEDKPEE